MCAGLPPYPQEFQYYGNDKISWVYHVAVWGARCALQHFSLSSCGLLHFYAPLRHRFHVLPREFVTHKWHAANKWAGTQREEVRQKMLNAFNKFKEASIRRHFAKLLCSCLLNESCCVTSCPSGHQIRQTP
jgi:hypothetical protein